MSRLLSLPIRRPVAVSMFFLAFVLLGLIGWSQMPVELIPVLTGDELSVIFTRRGSEPEVVEREILMPLESRVSALPEVAESWAEVRGSRGTYRVTFERGSDLKVRELELRRIAADLARDQPPGTTINVSAQDTTFLSRFAMIVQVTGGADRSSLHDLVEELVAPRLASVPGVSQVLTTGGSGRQLAVRVDPDRCSALDVTTEQVIAAVQQAASRLKFLGGLEDEVNRTAVMLDGRPRGAASLAETQVVPDRPVRLRHVAHVELASGQERSLFRVNGKPAVGLLVFQENRANLVRLGRELRSRIEAVRRELRPLGLDLLIGFDGAELVEEQIERLQKLAGMGFLIALLVLYLFLRQLRAVAVVAVAVPVSLLSALAFLFAAGQTFNLITLFGLAVGIGLLVDNSVVVYEAVQRQLEHGHRPEAAAVEGVRRTVRAIVAASATTGVVFLPLVLIDLENALVRSLVEIIALAILLPLLASLLVAVGLVPLLAHRLAAPAAVRRLQRRQLRRQEQGELVAPDRLRGLFTGFLTSALRQPAGWLGGVVTAVILTVVIALPWVSINTATQAPAETRDVQMVVRLPLTQRSLGAAASVFDRLERAALELAGVERVESFVQEEGGNLTVRLASGDDQPDTSAARVRQVIREAARELTGVEVLLPGEAGDGAQGGGQGGNPASALFGQGPAEVVVSGPDSHELERLATEIRGRLDSMPEVGSAWLSVESGLEELRVSPDHGALTAFGLTLDQVFPTLRLAGREGIPLQAGFPLGDGRELPLVVYRQAATGNSTDLGRLRLSTPAGPLPISALASVRLMPPPSAIVHHNGRRELVVRYRLDDDVPSTGGPRLAVEEEIEAAVRQSHRPGGYTVEVGNQEETTSWFKRIVVPVVLLLFLVLAMTFESLTMPVLVLLALPLTLLGSIWSLALAGEPLGMMALVGALVLLGLTVNPAILLVDRMQQRVLVSGWSAGAAALAAVRERARPVLMTTGTTISALLPLAFATGQENEFWPPFAVTVIGGLATSTLLTLVVIPVGFVLVQRLDRLFGRLGAWVLLGWILMTGGIMAPAILRDWITTLRWQLITGVLVAGVLLGIAALVLWRPRLPAPHTASGPPILDVRCLRKVYGMPGPVGRAWRAPDDFARRVLAAGGRAFDRRDAQERLLSLALVTGVLFYVSLILKSPFQGLVCLLVASLTAAWLLREIRRARGKANAVGHVDPGGLEGALAALAPWFAVGFFAYRTWLEPTLSASRTRVSPLSLSLIVLAVGLVQFGRRTARRVGSGALPIRVPKGSLRYVRSLWRNLARRVFGLDLPRDEVLALAGVQFRVERGMVGILGPNGAGKTTLLRQLAGVLEPTRGRITLGGVPLEKIRRYLARWVGYLPQDTSLPKAMTAREYLTYYASLYQLEPQEIDPRVSSLLAEVGLGERADEKIGGYSGGMRQRVAVARTLLRLPPVIIVDEPTVGLDPRERIRFRNLLVRLARDRIVLFSTHVVEDVAVACERVLVLARGRLVFDGPPAELNQVAGGRVWALTTEDVEKIALPPNAFLADQLPEPDGRARLRILSEERPHPEAKTIEPTIEDGYLALVGSTS